MLSEGLARTIIKVDLATLNNGCEGAVGIKGGIERIAGADARGLTGDESRGSYLGVRLAV